MSEERMGPDGDSEGARPTAAGVVEIIPVAPVRSASMLPLIILFQRAWEQAHSRMLSLSRLEYAAEAVALAEAVWHLLVEAGDEGSRIRWAVRLSEAKHWRAAVHDALADREEQEA